MSTSETGDSSQTGGAVRMPLREWLWRSYLRSAIVPLLVIELSFLAVYWASNLIVYRDNVAAVTDISADYLNDVARREAMSISGGMRGVSQVTQLFADQSLLALKGQFSPSAAEKARYAFSSDKVFHTVRDNGTTASFYSNATRIGPQEIAKVWKLAALDPLMMGIKKSNADISSIYFNSFDSYNRIYPYFDVINQYPSGMDIPSYNFYYEADSGHNPTRQPVWTDAYIDPAGHGWMVSSIAPVWNGNKLEGVVGIDLTLDTMISRLMALDLPWDGYALLVDRAGGIIAMPPAGEKDFGLKELTDHQYSQAIGSDTFKPDTFNVTKRPDTRPLAQAMARGQQGHVSLELDGEEHLASFANVPGPGWRLVIIAPKSSIFQHAETLRNQMSTVGLVMLAGLLAFYVLFFLFLYRRAHAMSDRMAAPLRAISGLIDRIGAGQYRQEFSGSQVRELDELGHRLVQTGSQLGSAHDHILAQQRIVSQALAQQRKVNEEQVRFVRVMSHELRTPLSVIDSGAQIIDRKAEVLTADALRARAGRLRASVRRISDLLLTLVSSTRVDDDQMLSGEPADLCRVVREIAEEMLPADRLDLTLPSAALMVADGAAIAIAIRNVLDNCLRYCPAASPVSLVVSVKQGMARIAISDCGPGIPASELLSVTERYFRGSSSAGTQGAGVGLHVARQMVEALQGSLVITADNGGTNAVITIPVDAETEG